MQIPEKNRTRRVGYTRTYFSGIGSGNAVTGILFPAEMASITLNLANFKKKKKILYTGGQVKTPFYTILSNVFKNIMRR